MRTTENGTIINNIKAVDDSTAFKDFLAVLDEDGAIVHIRTSEVVKMYNYLLSKRSKPQPSEPNNQKMDAFFTS